MKFLDTRNNSSALWQRTNMAAVNFTTWVINTKHNKMKVFNPIKRNSKS